MQKSIEESVKEFHEKYGHLVSSKPTALIPVEVTALRTRLIEEEWEELLRGVQQKDLVEIADGAADLIYVIVGTCVSYGIPIDRIFKEVHRSNMTKTPVKADGGSKYGCKTPKGPGYIAPDIKGILFNPDALTNLEKASMSPQDVQSHE
jgi:predicted HAD superfamily Cof-like phosphohydrolase